MTKTIKPHFRMDNDFIDFNIMSNMTGDELKIYLYFFRRSNSCKDLCFCSFADVKLRTGIGTESAKIIILSLSQKGFLAVINQGRKGEAPEYEVYSYPKIGAFNSTPPISASSVTVNGLDPHGQLLEYCQKTPKYNSMIHQVREKTFVTELEFRFDDQLTQIQIDQFLTALLSAMVNNDVNRMDNELSHFNACEISRIKQMYAVACALDMSLDEICQRNFELDKAGYMEYLVNLK